MRIGDLPDYTLPDDTLGYALSANIKNPLDPLIRKDSLEAARLFNINCAICHGEEGKANGPLATSGKIGGVANLTAEAYVKMADGTMYHSLFYGKNNMGSYASQLSRKQRWMIIQYIRTLQPKATTGASAAKAKHNRVYQINLGLLKLFKKHYGEAYAKAANFLMWTFYATRVPVMFAAIDLGLIKNEEVLAKAEVYRQTMHRHVKLFRRQYQSEIDKA